MLSNQTLDSLEQHKQHYSRHGWVRIDHFLSDECAEDFVDVVRKIADDTQVWRLATLVEGKAFVAKVNDYLTQEPYVRSHFIAELLRYAQQNDFQYFYEFIRLLGEDIHAPLELEAISDVWGSDIILNNLKQLTDTPQVRHIDAQLTCYKPGHFLKHHSDEGYHSKQKRKVAYVLGLSKQWQPDWGGLLHLQDADGRVIQSLIPQFNSLTLFEVPTAHFVSQVTNYCPASRYSLTGWLWE